MPDKFFDMKNCREPTADEVKELYVRGKMIARIGEMLIFTMDGQMFCLTRNAEVDLSEGEK